MKPAVIYVRVSTDEQVRGTSLDTQEAACRAWCERNGYSVARVFSDAGETAKTADRPKFLELVAWCQANRPAVCVVWKFDRWARNSTDHAIYARSLSKVGTRLVSATEAAEDDPAGRLLQTILSGIAQFDNEVRAQRTREAMRSIAKRGGWYTHAPYGYRFARAGELPVLVEDPAEAPIVRELFEAVAQERRSVAQAITWAAEHGLKATAVRKMLTRSVYAGFICGRLTDGQEVVAAFPGIVPREVFDSVRAIISGRRPNYGPRRAARAEFQLRGVLHCGVCRRLVTACWSTGHGGRYGYYQCRCGGARGRIEAVHAQWFDLLRQASVELSPFLAELRQEVRAAASERLGAAGDMERQSDAEVARLERARARLLDAYLAGALEKAAFESKDAELSEQLRRTREIREDTQQHALTVEQAVERAISLLDDPAALWERMTPERKRDLAEVYVGSGYELMPDGTCRTTGTDGLFSVLRSVIASPDAMAPHSAWLSNLVALMDRANQWAA